MAYLAVYKNGKKTHDGWFAGDKNDKVGDLLNKYKYMSGGKLRSDVIAADLYVYGVVGYNKVFSAKKGTNLVVWDAFSQILRSNDKSDREDAEKRLNWNGDIAVVLDTK